jgi:hypothetical protein
MNYSITYPDYLVNARDWELQASKGCLDSVYLVVDENAYELSFYDFTRAEQDVADNGEGYFFKPNVVLVPAVTKEHIARAVAEFVAHKEYNYLIEAKEGEGAYPQSPHAAVKYQILCSEVMDAINWAVQECKGWFGCMCLKINTKVYTMTCFDFVRSKQELEKTTQDGYKHYFFEENLVLLPKLTKEAIEKALADIATKGYERYLVQEKRQSLEQLLKLYYMVLRVDTDMTYKAGGIRDVVSRKVEQLLTEVIDPLPHDTIDAKIHDFLLYLLGYDTPDLNDKYLHSPEDLEAAYDQLECIAVLRGHELIVEKGYFDV